MLVQAGQTQLPARTYPLDPHPSPDTTNILQRGQFQGGVYGGLEEQRLRAICCVWVSFSFRYSRMPSRKDQPPRFCLQCHANSYVSIVILD